MNNKLVALDPISLQCEKTYDNFTDDINSLFDNGSHFFVGGIKHLYLFNSDSFNLVKSVAIDNRCMCICKGDNNHILIGLGNGDVGVYNHSNN